MGKIPQGILGGLSGKVGGVVGSSWKGINTLKTKPLSVANPRTAGQVAQRTKFAEIVEIGSSSLGQLVKPLWDRFASKQSGFNAFVQANIDATTNGLPVIAKGFVISKGKMAATVMSVAAAFEEDPLLSLEWSNDSGEGYKLATDKLYIMLVDRTSDKVVSVETGVVRSAAGASVDLGYNLPLLFNADVYTAFKRADGTVVSTSTGKPITIK